MHVSVGVGVTVGVGVGVGVGGIIISGIVNVFWSMVTAVCANALPCKVAPV